ncbi:hypothetical protein ACFQHO_00645 [Actinomadura yumaensis]|uniref:hypothetical protein n=1 Tax=Actinomadura TaxID=1988 RepID=UPI001326BC12|nr:hypothetical protein [Actinomadura sp. J1-007]MWK38487.1 hypothetical protein [Actinomadura sp. J1-007]
MWEPVRRADPVLQDDRDHHGAERSVHPLDDPAGAGRGGHLLGGQLPVGGGHRGQQHGSDARTADEQRRRQERLAGVRPGRGERDRAEGDQAHAGARVAGVAAGTFACPTRR